jgi:sec-independent protein translocase protein TatA
MLLIFLVILLIFGAKRIPEIARGLGKGIREFKDATHDIRKEISVDDTPSRIQPPRYAEPMPRVQAEPPQPVQAEQPGPGGEAPRS